MINPYPNTPVDKANAPIFGSPAAKLATARYTNTGQSSSVMTVSDNTSMVEIAAIGGGGVAMRWVAASDTQASVIAAGAGLNYDHVIPANTFRRFAVPVETAGAPTSVVGVNKKEGLYNRVAVIAAVGPASSVMTSEY